MHSLPHFLKYRPPNSLDLLRVYVENHLTFRDTLRVLVIVHVCVPRAMDFLALLRLLSIVLQEFVPIIVAFTINCVILPVKPAFVTSKLITLT